VFYLWLDNLNQWRAGLGAASQPVPAGAGSQAGRA